MKKKRQLIYLLLGLFCLLDFKARAQTAMFQEKIIAPLADRDNLSRFGVFGAVSIHGNFAVVGTPHDDEYGYESGAVYLYEYLPLLCDWVFREKIVPQELDGTVKADPGDEFGVSVAIHGDHIAIGAKSDYNNGADGIGPVVECGLVYIYKIVASSAQIQQHVHAFNNTGAEDNLVDDEFGNSVHLSGTHLIVGDHLDDTDEDGVDMGIGNTGAAFIYKWDGIEYDFENKVVSDAPDGLDFFGVSVSISSMHAAVGSTYGGPGATGIGKVEIYSLDAGDWGHNTTFLGTIVDPMDDDFDKFGASLEMNQAYLVVGAPYDEHDEVGADSLGLAYGSAYIFELDAGPGTWSLVEKIVPDDRSLARQFGYDVSISGNKIVVGSIWGTDGGGVYLFEDDGSGDWEEIQVIESVDGAAADHFGNGVDLYGDNLIVSAPFEDHTDVPPYLSGFEDAAGSAYLFELNTPADIPIIEASGVCIDGALVSMTIVGGDLNDADDWYWYEDDCTASPFAIGESIEVEFEDGQTYCARGVGDCDWFEDGDCGCITLSLEDGIWHKQTINTVRDQGTDVATDAAGSVYMVGEYFVSTEFEGGDVANEVITSGDFDRKSYIVKYDNCGNLIWVANSIDTNPYDDDNAVSLVLDELSGQVYVLGNYRRKIEFQSGVGSGDIDATPTMAVAGGGSNSRAYIAQFDMVNGDLNNLYDFAIDPSTNTMASDLAINELTGDIFVGGNFSGVGGNMLFIRRFLGGTIPDWTINGYAFNEENVRGLDFDEGTNRLWLLGDYKGSFSLLSSPAVSTSGVDAFVARISPATPTLDAIAYGNISGDMFGGGIAVDEGSGNAFITGYYNGMSTNVFGTGEDLTLLYSAGEDVYFFGLTPTMNSVWFVEHNGTCLSGDARGVDVSINVDGNPSFVGTFTREDLVLTDGSGVAYVGPSSNKQHIFAVSYDGAAETMNWENGTSDPTASNARHYAQAIDSDPFGNDLICGGFTEQIDYLSGTPISGPLTSFGQLASFTMRVEADVAGAFQLPTTVEDDESIESETLQNGDLAFFMNVYPNPISNDVTIEVGNFDSDQIGTITVLNLDGKVVLNQELQSNQMRIDFSELDAGVYFIQVTNGDQTAVKRVVKS